MNTKRALFATAMAVIVSLSPGCDDPGRTPLPHNKPMKPIADVIETHAPRLMQVEDVVGVYEGQTKEGQPVIRIMVRVMSDSLSARLPKELDGWPVEVEETGEIRPMGRK